MKKRGRPVIDVNERLSYKRIFRLNKFENNQLKLLAERDNLSVNTYLRKLVMDAYYRYAEEKTRAAQELYDEMFDD